MLFVGEDADSYAKALDDYLQSRDGRAETPAHSRWKYRIGKHSIYNNGEGLTMKRFLTILCLIALFAACCLSPAYAQEEMATYQDDVYSMGSNYYHTVTLKVTSGGNMPIYGADEGDLR